MLKMHNIVIDENKPVIANIDTAEKERSGSISFRWATGSGAGIMSIFRCEPLHDGDEDAQ